MTYLLATTPGQPCDPEQASVPGSSAPSRGQSQYPSLSHSSGISTTCEPKPVAHWSADDDARNQDEDTITATSHGNRVFRIENFIIIVSMVYVSPLVSKVELADATQEETTRRAAPVVWWKCQMSPDGTASQNRKLLRVLGRLLS